jgi:hypothetical protein
MYVLNEPAVGVRVTIHLHQPFPAFCIEAENPVDIVPIVPLARLNHTLFGVGFPNPIRIQFLVPAFA